MVKSKSYLLLGEGDFTYSLDMCRYIASLSSTAAAAGDGSDDEPSAYSIACTGVDTLKELRAKYKDIDFILRNIRACSNNNYKLGEDENGSAIASTSCASKSGSHQQIDNDGSREGNRVQVSTTILHGINAVQAEPDATNNNNSEDTNNTTTPPQSSYDHVLFHHPHLGTENAQLHSRFLQHFFHASSRRWMKSNGGLLYVTLVIGQCERWKCVEGALKQGLVLLRRSEFRAPPPPIDSGADGGKTYYSLRRHQSGRSFAKRRRMQQQPQQQLGESCETVCHTNDSETLVFGRACDYPTMSAVDTSKIDLLPWEDTLPNATNSQKDDKDAETRIMDVISTSVHPQTNPHPCQYCSKSFQEHRSLRNHMICSHVDCAEVKRWKLEKKGKKKKSNKKRTLEDDGKIECNDAENTMQQSNISKKENDGPPWICTICDSQRQKEVAAAIQNAPASQQEHNQQQPITTRTFPHKQALLDHQRAKHFGTHLDVKPDWYRSGANGEVERDDTNNNRQSTREIVVAQDSCPICNHPYLTEIDKLRHEVEFLPSSSEIANKLLSQLFLKKDDSIVKSDIINKNDNNTTQYQCQHCSKKFRELRARRQHENFCSLGDG